MLTEEGAPVNRVFPEHVNDIFEGEQLVLVGRYRRTGLSKVTITGTVRGEEQSFDFPATLIEESNDQSFAFVESLWALRRIGKIIDELDLVGTNEELINELVALSTKHGIMTPYTSFLADETSRPFGLAQAESATRAGSSLRRLEEADGAAAFSQRSAKNEFLGTDQVLSLSSALPTDDSLAGGFGGRGVYYRDIDTDEQVLATGVLQVDNFSLYCRGNVWCTPTTASINLETDLDKVTIVERFSKEYFELVADNSVTENKILCGQREGDELLVDFRGTTYWVK